MQKSVNEDREKWIGGSDIPAIMGISPFLTRYELLLYKAEINKSEFDGNEFTEYGNIMEPKIRDYINGSYDRKFKESKYEYRSSNIRCHLDGEDDNGVLEIKTTSKIYNNVNEYKVYLVQLLFYMMNVGKNNGMLAVYNRPSDFNEEFDSNRLKIYKINIEDYKDLCDEINEAVEKFKIDLDKIKENPLLSEEDLLPIDIQELSKKIIQIETQLVEYKELEKQEKELKNKLYNAMIDNNIKRWETPNGTKITLVEETPDNVEMVFNEEKLKSEQPILYTSYLEEQIKKGKSGYVKITLK